MVNKQKEIGELSKYLIEQYPGEFDGRFRRAVVLGMIEAIVESDRTPFAKVRDIKIALAALNIADTPPDER